MSPPRAERGALGSIRSARATSLPPLGSHGPVERCAPRPMEPGERRTTREANGHRKWTSDGGPASESDLEHVGGPTRPTSSIGDVNQQGREVQERRAERYITELRSTTAMLAVACVGVLAYLALTPDQPNRPLLWVLTSMPIALGARRRLHAVRHP